MPVPSGLSKNPWPMKWIVVSIAIFVVGYTFLTLHYRKVNRPYEPYHDLKEHALTHKLLTAGYQRISVPADLPTEPGPVRGTARISAGPGGIPADQPNAHVEKAPQAFDIDMLRCIYCGLCQEVCPEEAIFLQNQFSMSGYTRAEMVNHKDRLYELGGTLPDPHLKWDHKKSAAEHGNAHE